MIRVKRVKENTSSKGWGSNRFQWGMTNENEWEKRQRNCSSSPSPLAIYRQIRGKERETPLSLENLFRQRHRWRYRSSPFASSSQARHLQLPSRVQIGEKPKVDRTLEVDEVEGFQKWFLGGLSITDARDEFSLGTEKRKFWKKRYKTYKLGERYQHHP